MHAERLSAADLVDKTDAGTGLDGICFVSDDFRSLSLIWDARETESIAMEVASDQHTTLGTAFHRRFSAL
jgi:hypothetical protein